MELLQIGLFWTLLVGALATVLVVAVVAGESLTTGWKESL